MVQRTIEKDCPFGKPNIEARILNENYLNTDKLKISIEFLSFNFSTRSRLINNKIKISLKISQTTKITK